MGFRICTNIFYLQSPDWRLARCPRSSLSRRNYKDFPGSAVFRQLHQMTSQTQHPSPSHISLHLHMHSTPFFSISEILPASPSFFTSLHRSCVITIIHLLNLQQRVSRKQLWVVVFIVCGWCRLAIVHAEKWKTNLSLPVDYLG